MNTNPNTKPWFNTPERVEALRKEALNWIGTPFFPNSNTPGPAGGVSCQKLASEIYRRCGCCAVDVPEVPMAHAKFSKESLLIPFMDALPMVVRQDIKHLAAGDTIGFEIGNTVHHVAIMLDSRQFVHCMSGIGATIGTLNDPTWSSRLRVAWRIIEQ
jgi:cell wall-associated NlpC family hydrolase